MNNLNKYFDTNKATWDKKVAFHAKSDMYALEAFKAGKSSLNRFELHALGDVSGKDLLHLQCHFGQDTLSLGRMGANCTGIDFSEKAIELADELSAELNIDARFICCNVLDVSEHIKDRFDIVFTSYGVIGWIPDLKPWARMIFERLKPGGFFYMVEFHPIVWMFDYTSDPPELKYGYQQAEVIAEEYQGTYADEKAAIVSKEYGWNHGLSKVVNSLIEAGLKIEFLQEHELSPYNVFPGLVKTDDGLYKTQDDLYPLIFEIKASKP